MRAFLNTLAAGPDFVSCIEVHHRRIVEPFRARPPQPWI